MQQCFSLTEGIRQGARPPASALHGIGFISGSLRSCSHIVSEGREAFRFHALLDEPVRPFESVIWPQVSGFRGLGFRQCSRDHASVYSTEVLCRT